MKTIWVSRYYNGTADVFDEDHGPPSWPYVDAFEAKQRIAELETAKDNYKQMVVEQKQRIAELEAQLPKAVNPKKGTHFYFCECGCVVGYSDRYCCQCGAKLKWEDA